MAFRIYGSIYILRSISIKAQTINSNTIDIENRRTPLKKSIPATSVELNRLSNTKL